MKTVDRITIRAPIGRVFDLATNVERWPRILAHYRSVRFLHRPNGEREHGSTGTVEIAAWRPFGPIRYPAWWVSEMTVDPGAHEVRYRHVRGITRGMDVRWRLVARPHGVDVTIEHEWAGPAWPVVGALVARLVIGPVFIHGIAQRTLAGIKEVIEGEARG